MRVVWSSSPQKLTDKRYRWLEQNFKSKSDAIKTKKDLINDNHSHTNIVSSESIFRMDDTGALANSPFFDIEDNHLVKCDLWLASTIALELADWFYGVNKGLNVIKFMPGFDDAMRSLGAETNALRAKMIETDRYKAAMARSGGAKEKERELPLIR